MNILTTKHLKICVFLFLSACLLCLGRVSLSYGAEKPLVAVVLSSSIKPFRHALKGFHDELKKRGLEYTSREVTLGGADSNDILLPIKKLNPTIIYTIGTRATLIAKKEFPHIPVVFSMVLNPVASKVVKSMNSPGENVTGASMDIPPGLQFRYLKKILPRVEKVGVIYSESETGVIVKAAADAAKANGLELIAEAVKSPGDVPDALARLVGKVDCLWSVADSTVFTRETVRELLLITLREKIPFVGLSSSFVKAGALAAFQMDAGDIGSQAASIAGNLLRGVDPSVLPVTEPRRIRIVLNDNTIKLLGIIVPRKVYESAEIIKP